MYLLLISCITLLNFVNLCTLLIEKGRKVETNDMLRSRHSLCKLVLEDLHYIFYMCTSN